MGESNGVWELLLAGEYKLAFFARLSTPQAFNSMKPFQPCLLCHRDCVVYGTLIVEGFLFFTLQCLSLMLGIEVMVSGMHLQGGTCGVRGSRVGEGPGSGSP